MQKTYVLVSAGIVRKKWAKKKKQLSVFTQRFGVKIKLPVTALETHIEGDFLSGRKKAEKRRDSSTQNIAW